VVVRVSTWKKVASKNESVVSLAIMVGVKMIPNDLVISNLLKVKGNAPCLEERNFYHNVIMFSEGIIIESTIKLNSR